MKRECNQTPGLGVSNREASVTVTGKTMDRRALVGSELHLGVQQADAQARCQGGVWIWKPGALRRSQIRVIVIAVARDSRKPSKESALRTKLRPMNQGCLDPTRQGLSTEQWS
jgi:hypothetical protein